MPGIIRVKVISGCDFPVMDRASDLTDAFVEMKIGNTTQKTEVCRKSLNPQWNSDWFRFEVDDEELQDEPLTLKVLDYDVYSAHDVIGKVFIDLNPLLIKDGANSVSGWFPVYDTMHGVRGYLKVKVKIEFFEDTNKFKQTSCGVQFFSSSCIPTGYVAMEIEGFVDELVVNHDPEYQWIDKIRTPRASNELRLRLFTKLAGELKRKIGLKVIDAGGNAIIGYQQKFDLEGETGVVARGIGTMVTLTKSVLQPGGVILNLVPQQQSCGISPSVDDSFVATPKKPGEVFVLPSTPVQQHFVGSKIHGHLRQYRTISTSSDNEHILEKPIPLLSCSTSPEVINFAASDKNNITRQGALLTQVKKIADDTEFPFYTISAPPAGFVVHFGGVVSARSVKLFESLDEPDECSNRLSWWNEIRCEIRSHCRSLGCNAVTGYLESTSICDDVIILSASGTAIVARQPEILGIETVLANENAGDPLPEIDVAEQTDNACQPDEDSTEIIKEVDPFVNAPGCLLCHVPYVDGDLPPDLTTRRCMMCRVGKVPSVLFATVDVPQEVAVTGDGCFVQARVCRVKKKEKGESNAENVSQVLPFVEYELHQQMMNKLKIKGMNALFGVRSQISVGDQALIGIMSGTALYLSALPPPPVLRVTGSKHNSIDNDRKLMEVQKRILDISAKNRSRYGVADTLNPLAAACPTTSSTSGQTTKAMETGAEDVRGIGESLGHFDLLSGAKDALVLEVDDRTDEEVISLTLDGSLEDGMCCYSLDFVSRDVPLLLRGRPQLFTLFQRSRLEEETRSTQYVTTICENLLQRLLFKVRLMRPCCVNHVTFHIDIPDDDCFEVSLVASVVSMRDKSRALVPLTRPRRLGASFCDELVFPIDVFESHEDVTHTTQDSSPALRRLERKDQESQHDLANTWPTADLVTRRKRTTTLEAAADHMHADVIITPLAELPHRRIMSYLGNLNLFFIRESTSVKEDGGSAMFVQLFIAECYAVVKAHALAIGANAVVAFELNQIVLLDSPHKNQAQCLLNVSGDMVIIEQDALGDFVNSARSSRRKTTSSTSLEGCSVNFDAANGIIKRPSLETQV